jgi:hypothetical protein
LCQECEKNIEAVQDDMKHEESRHNWTQTTFNNGVKVENKTLNIWRELVSDAS